jgi:hypothetical protein
MEFKRFNEFAKEIPCLDGNKVKIKDIINQEILVTAFKVRTSKYKKSNSERCLTIQFKMDGANHIFFTGSSILTEQIEKYKDQIPFLTTIKQIDKFYTFT